MRWVAALLAAVLAALAPAGCGDGAEPGAPEGATLVLDFQPNAVHAGIYAAKARGYFADEDLELKVQEPSSSADGAKLLESGRADFAILDINDFGIARERGAEIEAIAAIVQLPLAAVIAADRDEINSPADLDGKTVGVTGVPSDDAVLDTVLAEGGLDPDAVERQTIGFRAVPLLAAGRLDAATGFWNAEAAELERRGVPIHELRVEAFGAPRYPELVVAAPADAQEEQGCALLAALERSYAELNESPEEPLAALLAEVGGLDPESQRAQLNALFNSAAFKPGPELDPATFEAWERWAAEHELIADPVGGATPPDC
jgi:NitT/TauT family transport system substrate-binding protein/putative hydroxymethylpyrimidine transport system substrate-binding protein